MLLLKHHSAITSLTSLAGGISSSIFTAASGFGDHILMFQAVNHFVFAKDAL
jgi:hypothetical protein